MTPSRKVSPRCGKDSCPFYRGGYAHPSHCRVVDDRRDCYLSMKQRKKSVNTSRRRAKEEQA